MLRLIGAAGVIALLLLTGCAGTIPVNYEPQNFVRYDGAADIGNFTYKPADDGELKPNQIRNTALGSIYFPVNVADLVQRATALELEKTGFVIGDQNPLAITGEVLDFKADDLGYSVDWSYSVRYVITRKADGAELFDEVFAADPVKTGKFGSPADYAPSVNELILSAYDKFIRNETARAILSEGT